MSDRTEVYLFRHGEALNSVQSHLIFGQSGEIPLTETGAEQSQRLGSVLIEKGLFPDAVYSSTAVRTRQTGEITLQAMGLETDIIEDERLHEQSTGDWTGRVAAEVFTDETVRTIEASGKDFRSPNGESMNDVGERMFDWLESLEPGTEANPRIVFAFTHGGPIRCVASRLLDWTHAETYGTKPDNTSASTFTKVDGLWRPGSIGIDASDLRVDTLIPAEIGSRLIGNEAIREHLQSIIWFGSMRNNRDVHARSDYDVQIILDKPNPDLIVQLNDMLRDYPGVDLSIMYLQDIYGRDGDVIFQDGTKGPFFMHVLASGKVLYGKNVYAEATEKLTLEDMRPSILFTVREYLSRLRVMAAQSPDDTLKFKKYSLKLFKDLALYEGAAPLEDMARLDNADAQAMIEQMHEFSEQSQEALTKITDYEHNFTQAEMASLLCEYEAMVERISNE